MPQRHMPALTLLTFQFSVKGFIWLIRWLCLQEKGTGRMPNSKEETSPAHGGGGGGVQPQRKSENTQERVLKEEGSKFLMVIGTGKGRGQMEHFHLSVRNQETEVMRAWN